MFFLISPIFLFNELDTTAKPYYPTDNNSMYIANSSSPIYKMNNQRTGLSPYNTSNNYGDLIWKTQIGGDGVATPAIDKNGDIYVGNWMKYFHGFYPNGTIKWTFDDTWAWFASSPAVGNDGNIYVGSYDHNFYSFTPNGTVRWKYHTGDKIYSSPAITNNGSIIFGCWNDYVYSLSMNGKLYWKYKTGDDIWGTPALDDSGNIYIVSYDDMLYCLHPNGTLKWNITVGRIIGNPTISQDGIVYVRAYTVFWAIYPNGSIKWKMSIPYSDHASSSPAIDKDGIIYIGCGKNLYSVYPNGTVRWIYRTGGAIYTSPTISNDGYIYFGTGGRHLFALYNNGALYWRFKCPERISCSPAIDKNGRIIFQSYGFLYCLHSKEPSSQFDISSFSGDGYVNISWRHNDHSRNYTIDGINIYRSKQNEPFQHIDTIAFPLDYNNDTEIKNGMKYQYYIVPFNTFGNGPMSNIVNGTPEGPSSPPVNISHNQEYNEINISWDPPIDSGGYSIKYYYIYFKNPISNNWTATSSLTDYKIYRNLKPKLSYTVKVSAVTSFGEGSISEPIFFSLFPPPGEPINMNTNMGPNFIRITWDRPLYIGNLSDIIEYRIYRDGKYYTNVSGDFTSLNDTGLINGQTYSYKVSAVTLAGEGPLSYKISNTPYAKPSPPVNIKIDVKGTSISLSWGEPMDPGGYEITSYRVYRYFNGEEAGMNVVLLPEFKDFNFPRGEYIEFRVSAINKLGRGNLSDPVNITIELGGIPSKPRDVRLEIVDEGIRISWCAPLDSGDEEIIEYIVYRMIENKTEFIKIATVNEMGYIDTNLAPNYTYIYKVTAYNVVGEGPGSHYKTIYINNDYIPSVDDDIDDDTPSDKNSSMTFILVVIGILVIILILILMFFLIIKGKKEKLNINMEALNYTPEPSVEMEIFGDIEMNQTTTPSMVTGQNLEE